MESFYTILSERRKVCKPMHLRVTEELCGLGHVQAASKEQNQNKQYDQAYPADGVETPVLGVWPNGKTPDKRHNEDYRENEQERHTLAASLTAAARCLLVSILADSATRGSAISSFTLASTAW